MENLQFQENIIWPEEALSVSMSLLKKTAGEKTIIFDVGAHRGESLKSFDKNIRDSYVYFGFEPNPDAYFVFKEVANEILTKRSEIYCLQKAVGNLNGKITFLKTKESAVGGILLPVNGLSERVPSGDHLIADEIEVEMITLSTLIKDYNYSSIDILKIDTEGYDLEVLKGGNDIIKSQVAKVIITEVFFVPYRTNQAYFWDIASFMHANDYHFVNLYDTRNTSQGRLYTGNGLWVSNEIALLNNFL